MYKKGSEWTGTGRAIGFYNNTIKIKTCASALPHKTARQ